VLKEWTLKDKDEKKEALELFKQVWNQSSNEFERFASAHYVARHQETVEGKLKWDEAALELALKINDDNVSGAFPSLYLNIAKDFEDLNDFTNARKNYQLALTYMDRLPDNGYGNLIKTGIMNGIERVS
jgi:hypothetical protein